MTTLTRKFASGAAWMVGMRVAVNLLGVVSTIVLARLLAPEDFGIVALAGSAYAFFNVFGQVGFDSALIYMENPEEDHYSSAWTANILVGLTIAVLMFVVAQPVSRFFENPAIAPVVCAFAILSLAKGCENIGVVNFRKNLAFKGDFLYFVLPKIVSVIVAIVSAYLLRNYWALVIGMASMQLSTLIYSHVSQPLRPKLRVNRIGELFKFSRWVLAGRLVEYASRNGLEIILGKIRNAGDVGILAIARQIALLPTTEVTAPINRALFPSLAKIAQKEDRLKEAVLKVVSVTAIVSLPTAIGLYAIAEPLVLVVLGEKWRSAIPVLAVLALYGLADTVRSLFSPLMLARGRPDILTAQNGIFALIAIPMSIALAAQMGARGVAYAMLAAAIVSLPVLFIAARRQISLSFRDYIRAIYRPAISAILMLAVLTWTQAATHLGTSPSVLKLIAIVGTGACAYSFALLTLWLVANRPDGPESWALAYVRGAVGK